MKKILLNIGIIVLLFIGAYTVNAEEIYNINMDVYIDNSGNAHVTEVWDTNATEKTEYYHAYYNIGDSKITDFKVSDETREYTYIDWDINGDLEDKAYHYGYNYDYDGIELCFGKSSYGKHKYTLTYTIEGFVYNTSDDKQVIYWTLLNKINPAPKNVEIVLHADEAFSDELPVWGYGNYGGLAYVYDGKIYLSNDHLDNTDYMVLLAEFDEKMFNTEYTLTSSFDDVTDMAENGSTKYVEKTSFLDIIFGILSFLFQAFFWFLIIFACVKSANKPNAGSYNLNFKPRGNKVKKDINLFRDIPCNKDIFRAYWVATFYKLTKKKTDFLGAMILRWHKLGYVTIESKEKGKIFKKEDTVIVFHDTTFEIDQEQKLFDYMKTASKDGVLESKEFEKWCRDHYSKIFKWFDDVLDYETKQLVSEGKITIEEKKSLGIFKNDIYNVDESMMEEAEQMAGLKQFFKEFDNMSDKEAIDVMLWEEYLIFAQIFGVADKVAKQFKKLYPDVITDYDYDSIVFINTMSNSGVVSATSARSRAEAYSSGGGGFSSGGGGGGSFGGGGGSFGGGSR